MQSVEERKKQLSLILKTCYITDIAYLALHLLYLILFLISKSYTLAYIDLVSIFLYIIFPILIIKGKYYIYALCCGAEFFVFVIIMTILCGFSSGFHLNIIGLCIVSFFVLYMSRKTKNSIKTIRYNVFSIIIYFSLLFYCSFNEPLFPLERWLNVVLFAIHVAILFTFIIACLMAFTKSALALEARITNESRIDRLTQIPNRNDLYIYLYSINDKENYSLAIFDIDDFKKVNDTYGHIYGDFILKELARLAQENSNNSFVARYGGEEFVVIIKTDGNDDVAFELIENIRSKIVEHIFDFDTHQISITISSGIQRYKNNITNDQWIGLADNKLYKCKSTGKNKTIM